MSQHELTNSGFRFTLSQDPLDHNGLLPSQEYLAPGPDAHLGTASQGELLQLPGVPQLDAGLYGQGGMAALAALNRGVPPLAQLSVLGAPSLDALSLLGSAAHGSAPPAPAEPRVNKPVHPSVLKPEHKHSKAARRGPMDEMRQLVRILVKLMPESARFLAVSDEGGGGNRVKEEHIKEYLMRVLGTRHDQEEPPPFPDWGVVNGWAAYLAELFTWAAGRVVTQEDALRCARRLPGRSWETLLEELERLRLCPQSWPLPLRKEQVREVQKLYEATGYVPKAPVAGPAAVAAGAPPGAPGAAAAPGELGALAAAPAEGAGPAGSGDTPPVSAASAAAGAAGAPAAAAAGPSGGEREEEAAGARPQLPVFNPTAPALHPTYYQGPGPSVKRRKKAPGTPGAGAGVGGSAPSTVISVNTADMSEMEMLHLALKILQDAGSKRGTTGTEKLGELLIACDQMKRELDQTTAAANAAAASKAAQATQQLQMLQNALLTFNAQSGMGGAGGLLAQAPMFGLGGLNLGGMGLLSTGAPGGLQGLGNLVASPPLLPGLVGGPAGAGAAPGQAAGQAALGQAAGPLAGPAAAGGSGGPSKVRSQPAHEAAAGDHAAPPGATASQTVSQPPSNSRSLPPPLPPLQPQRPAPRSRDQSTQQTHHNLDPVPRAVGLPVIERGTVGSTGAAVPSAPAVAAGSNAASAAERQAARKDGSAPGGSHSADQAGSQKRVRSEGEGRSGGLDALAAAAAAEEQRHGEVSPPPRAATGASGRGAHGGGAGQDAQAEAASPGQGGEQEEEELRPPPLRRPDSLPMPGDMPKQRQAEAQQGWEAGRPAGSLPLPVPLPWSDSRDAKDELMDDDESTEATADGDGDLHCSEAQPEGAGAETHDTMEVEGPLPLPVPKPAASAGVTASSAGGGAAAAPSAAAPRAPRAIDMRSRLLHEMDQGAATAEERRHKSQQLPLPGSVGPAASASARGTPTGPAGGASALGAAGSQQQHMQGPLPPVQPGLLSGLPGGMGAMYGGGHYVPPLSIHLHMGGAVPNAAQYSMQLMPQQQQQQHGMQQE